MSYEVPKGDLTYQEFNIRRNALIADLNRARKQLKRLTDAGHTQLFGAGVQIMEQGITLLEHKLYDLRVQWETQQREKGVSS